MDSFEVTAKSTDVLQSSHLIDKLQNDAENMERFPLIWNGYAYKFEEINGGYVESEAYHLVKISATGMQIGSIINLNEGRYELHLNNSVWVLEAKDYFEYQDGPVYTLCLKVTGYNSYEHSFAEEMEERVDERWTEYK